MTKREQIAKIVDELLRCQDDWAHKGTPPPSVAEYTDRILALDEGERIEVSLEAGELDDLRNPDHGLALVNAGHWDDCPHRGWLILHPEAE